MPGSNNENAEPSRSRSYKCSGKTTDDLRRRRNDSEVKLRKTKRDDQLNKKRNIDHPEETVLAVADALPHSIPQILDGVNSDDEKQQFLATQAARKILSKERDPPINLLIEAGLIPKLVEFLSRAENPSLQFEAAWALTNVASGSSEQTMTVVNAGAVPPLLNLLSSQYDHIAEQAVWALGNIAGDGAKQRDIILSLGVMPHLIKLVNPGAQVSMIRNVVWTLSNLCRNKNPSPEFSYIRPALPVLANLLHYSDNEVLADTCWAFSYATDGSNENIEEVLHTGVLPQIVTLLASPVQAILNPALRTVGNIVTGSDNQTDAVIKAGALPILCHLLSHEKNNVKKEAAWAVSNIIAGNQIQIQAVLDEGILQPLANVLRQGDPRAQKEAAWAFTNLTSGGTVQQIMEMVNAPVSAVPLMCNLLDSKDTKTITVVLDGIRNLMKLAEQIDQVNQLALMIEECGGLDKLELLQNHESEQIYHQVVKIIDDYFTNPEESDNDCTRPTQGQFQFNNPEGPNEFNFS